VGSEKKNCPGEVEKLLLALYDEAVSLFIFGRDIRQQL
jgi:hypothetical protein